MIYKERVAMLYAGEGNMIYIEKGSTEIVSYPIVRKNGMVSDIQFAVEVFPKDIEVSFSPATGKVEDTKLTITIKSNEATLPGNKTLLITGNPPGLNNPVRLVVSVSEATQVIEIPSVIDADFSLSLSGEKTVSVAATATSTKGSITGYSWSGDGGVTASGKEASLVFSSSGQKNITLTVSDDKGATKNVVHSITIPEVVTTTTVKQNYNVSCRFTSKVSYYDLHVYTLTAVNTSDAGVTPQSWKWESKENGVVQYGETVDVYFSGREYLHMYLTMTGVTPTGEVKVAEFEDTIRDVNYVDPTYTTPYTPPYTTPYTTPYTPPYTPPYTTTQPPVTSTTTTTVPVTTTEATTTIKGEISGSITVLSDSTYDANSGSGSDEGSNLIRTIKYQANATSTGGYITSYKWLDGTTGNTLTKQYFFIGPYGYLKDTVSCTVTDSAGNTKVLQYSINDLNI